MGRYLKLAMTVVSQEMAVAPTIAPATGEEKATPPAPDAVRNLRRAGIQVAPCGSPACAGCYDVGGGKKIHPPKCGPDYLNWLERWEPRGRKQ